MIDYDVDTAHSVVLVDHSLGSIRMTSSNSRKRSTHRSRPTAILPGSSSIHPHFPDGRTLARWSATSVSYGITRST